MKTHRVHRTFALLATVGIALFLCDSESNAAQKEIQRLSCTWTMNDSFSRVRLILRDDQTFILTVRDQGSTEGTWVATDDEIGLRADNDFRHFRYRLRGLTGSRVLTLTPSDKDWKSERARSLLDRLPPTWRGQNVSYKERDRWGHYGDDFDHPRRRGHERGHDKSRNPWDE
jgi:hypothetical protein